MVRSIGGKTSTTGVGCGVDVLVGVLVGVLVLGTEVLVAVGSCIIGEDEGGAVVGGVSVELTAGAGVSHPSDGKRLEEATAPPSVRAARRMKSRLVTCLIWASSLPVLSPLTSSKPLSCFSPITFLSALVCEAVHYNTREQR